MTLQTDKIFNFLVTADNLYLDDLDFRICDLKILTFLIFDVFWSTDKTM